ncbi:MAG: hypothetical protein GVY24_02460 [Planctomycetes bacterium]|nr:hypothetical protein [Planctomycetota bacterium]
MACHVAILKRPYARAILGGTKTVESRLTRTAMPPFGLIEPGQRIYIKVSAGRFVAVARAGEVASYEGLTPADIDKLRRRFQPSVGGDDAYWRMKRDSRFAVFVKLAEVEPIDVGPAYKPINMRAWHVLDDAADPIREATLTPGAIRNGYLTINLDITSPYPGVQTGVPASVGMPPQPFTLILPDQSEVRTDYARGHMLRFRGWRRLFREHRIKAGDVVRFVHRGGGRYRVSFRPAPASAAS